MCFLLMEGRNFEVNGYNYQPQSVIAPLTSWKVKFLISPCLSSLETLDAMRYFYQLNPENIRHRNRRHYLDGNIFKLGDPFADHSISYSLPEIEQFYK